jgi:hypothetical protein
MLGFSSVTNDWIARVTLSNINWPPLKAGGKLHEGCRQFRPYMGQSHGLHPRQIKPISSRTAVVQRPISLFINTVMVRADHSSSIAWPWQYHATPKRRRMFTRTRCNIPKDSNRHRCDNLKSRVARLFRPVTPKPRSQETTFASSTLLYLQGLISVLLILRFRRCCPKGRKQLSGFSCVQTTSRCFGKRCSYNVRGDTYLSAGDVWESNQSAHLSTLHPPPHLYNVNRDSHI